MAICHICDYKLGDLPIPPHLQGKHAFGCKNTPACAACKDTARYIGTDDLCITCQQSLTAYKLGWAAERRVIDSQWQRADSVGGMAELAEGILPEPWRTLFVLEEMLHTPCGSKIKPGSWWDNE